MPLFSVMPGGIVNYELFSGISAKVYSVVLVVLKMQKEIFFRAKQIIMV